MQPLREVIRGSLARSLRSLAEEDRLAAALPVVCGTALAAHCTVAQLDADRTLHLGVDGPEWLGSLLGMREMLQHDLQRVAGVPLAGLHFQQAGFASNRPVRTLSREPVQVPSGSTRSTRGKPATRPWRPA